jgi:predicted kinase
MTGLMGTGKTTLAQALGRRLGLVVVSSDAVRKKLAGVPLTEHHFEPFSEGIYSDAFSRRTYSEMFREAGEALDKGDSVVLDASFKKAADRQKAQEIAWERAVEFLLVECFLSDEQIEERLEARSKTGTISDGRWELLEEQKRDFDAITGLPERYHITIDTSQPEGQAVSQILARLGIERDIYEP